MSYVIIKMVKNEVKQTELPVIMLNSQSEVLEFDEEHKALEFAELMNTNTDSGHNYKIKKIG